MSSDYNSWVTPSDSTEQVEVKKGVITKVQQAGRILGRPVNTEELKRLNAGISVEALLASLPQASSFLSARAL